MTAHETHHEEGHHLDVSVERRDNEDGSCSLAVTVAAADVQQHVEEVYRQQARRVELPGFRRGKVPRALVERHLPREKAQEEAVSMLVEEGYEQALKQAGIEPLQDAELEKAELQEDGSLAIQLKVVPRPQVSLGEYKGLALTVEKVQVGDDEVDAEIQRLREQHADWAATDEPAAAGDLVIVDYRLEIDGKPVEGQATERYPCLLGSDKLFPELNELLLGARAGDQRRTPKQLPPEAGQGESGPRQGELVVTVGEVRRHDLPALDDAFAQRVGGESLEALRAAIKQRLERMAESDFRARAAEQLASAALDNAKLELPARAVEEVLEGRLAQVRKELEERNTTLERYLEQEGLTLAEFRRNIEAQVRADLKRRMVLDAIGRQEGIEVTSSDVIEQAAAVAVAQGLTAAGARRLLRSRSQLRRLVNLTYLRKVEEFLLEHAAAPAAGER